ncbi:hypothetical protein E4U53_006880 [Claviceps sorghi]|nr:hypothetical protein E4U53_006880 [Claviceps sorghi]
MKTRTLVLLAGAAAVHGIRLPPAPASGEDLNGKPPVNVAEVQDASTAAGGQPEDDAGQNGAVLDVLMKLKRPVPSHLPHVPGHTFVPQVMYEKKDSEGHDIPAAPADPEANTPAKLFWAERALWPYPSPFPRETPDPFVPLPEPLPMPPQPHTTTVSAGHHHHTHHSHEGSGKGHATSKGHATATATAIATSPYSSHAHGLFPHFTLNVRHSDGAPAATAPPTPNQKPRIPENPGDLDNPEDPEDPKDHEVPDHDDKNDGQPPKYGKRSDKGLLDGHFTQPVVIPTQPSFGNWQLEVAKEPKEPKKPKKPEEPKPPKQPEEPEVPEVPKPLEKPKKPDVPKHPKKPKKPEEPKPPKQPEDPEDPPKEPEEPEEPENPEDPEDPEDPDDPDDPEDANDSKDDDENNHQPVTKRVKRNPPARPTDSSLTKPGTWTVKVHRKTTSTHLARTHHHHTKKPPTTLPTFKKPTTTKTLSFVKATTTEEPTLTHHLAARLAPPTSVPTASSPCFHTTSTPVATEGSPLATSNGTDVPTHTPLSGAGNTIAPAMAVLAALGGMLLV